MLSNGHFLLCHIARHLNDLHVLLKSKRYCVNHTCCADEENLYKYIWNDIKFIALITNKCQNLISMINELIYYPVQAPCLYIANVFDQC